ncbi:MAG: endonuclease/exonuclease/phosphatase family protein [Phycisphaerales bacterium]
MNHSSLRPRPRGLGILLVVAAFAFLAVPPACAQNVGQCVRLDADRPEGVPRHREARNSFSGDRFPDGAVAKVVERAADARWFKVQVGADASWVAAKYVGDVVPCDQSGGTTTTPTGSIVVGTWNIEWLKEGKERGFPEFQGASAIPPRTQAEYDRVASIIKGLQVRILLLQEINGLNTDGDEEAEAASSVELDRLVLALGEGGAYRYAIARSGSAQRVAVLYDSRVVHLEWTCEGSMTNRQVQSASLFARQPFLAYFKVFADGVEMNDLVVVGVHLASGQDKNKNHDQAMTEILAWLDQERAANSCIPLGERDILIAGDFNANRFTGAVEAFWDDMERGPWDVLANTPGYPATRLSGDPPAQSTSQIDYVIISAGPGGLAGQEVSAAEAAVRGELVTAGGGDGMAFRRGASDHLPVTVQVRVVADND